MENKDFDLEQFYFDKFADPDYDPYYDEQEY